MNGFYRKSGLAISPHYFILQGFPWFEGNFCCCFTLLESKNLNSVMRKLRIKWDRQKCLHCNNRKDCYTLEGRKILISDRHNRSFSPYHSEKALPGTGVLLKPVCRTENNRSTLSTGKQWHISELFPQLKKKKKFPEVCLLAVHMKVTHEQ